jgi:hypothetical protein
MASLDVPPAPRPEGASPHSSTPRSRTVHSRQMSSLSMNTLATTSQSHHPSESLLRGGERTEQPPRQHPPRPDPSYVGCRPRFPLVDKYLFMFSRSQTKDYWESTNVRRVRRWGLFQGVLLSIMGKSPLAWVCGCELTQHRRFLGILHSSSLLHRLQGLSGPSIGSATAWYLLSSLCPLSDSSRHVIYSAIPYYRATSSITIPDHITPSYFAISPLVLPLCTNRRQSCPCLRMEKCSVWLEPAWSMPLES